MCRGAVGRGNRSDDACGGQLLQLVLVDAERAVDLGVVLMLSTKDLVSASVRSWDLLSAFTGSGDLLSVSRGRAVE